MTPEKRLMIVFGNHLYERKGGNMNEKSAKRTHDYHKPPFRSHF